MKTITPDHSPTEVKTLNCSPDFPSPPPSDLLPTIPMIHSSHPYDYRLEEARSTKKKRELKPGDAVDVYNPNDQQDFDLDIDQPVQYEPVSLEDIQDMIDRETIIERRREEQENIDLGIEERKQRRKKNFRLFDSGSTRSVVADPNTVDGIFRPHLGIPNVVGGGIPIIGWARDSKLGKALIVPTARQDLISTP